MNFYYEILLNFNEELFSFYEWSKNDKLEMIKKIPLLRVKTKLLQEILLYDFKIDLDLLEQLIGRTSCKNSSNTISCACVFCDTKNCIAIEFDQNGSSISRSALQLEDENNICEIAYSLKCRDINITKTKKLKVESTFRQEEHIKKIITKEILELYKNKNSKKLQYLYYEWFNKTEENMDKIIKEMFEDIKMELKKIHYDVYKIIELSYHKI